mmetsp:Transcript_22016/g.65997  ORF Transcript_22016/g.65997 Transcript_22016/m.65997 type:complete len:197 (+) Transcript_22016:753-1343(+)
MDVWHWMTDSASATRSRVVMRSRAPPRMDATNATVRGSPTCSGTKRHVNDRRAMSAASMNAAVWASRSWLWTHGGGRRTGSGGTPGGGGSSSTWGAAGSISMAFCSISMVLCSLGGLLGARLGEEFLFGFEAHLLGRRLHLLGDGLGHVLREAVDGLGELGRVHLLRELLDVRVRAESEALEGLVLREALDDDLLG